MGGIHRISRPDGAILKALSVAYRGIFRAGWFLAKPVLLGFLTAVGAALAVLLGVTQATGGDVTKVFTEFSLTQTIRSAAPSIQVEVLTDEDRALIRALIESGGGTAP